MKKRRYIAVLLSLLISAQTVVSCYGEEADKTDDITIAENDENTYQFSVSDAEEQVPAENNELHYFGSVPSDIDNAVPFYKSEYSTYRDLPSSYILDKEQYPALRDQGNYGTCWAFAAIGLSEFDLISKNLADKSLNLSELQLAYFTYNSAVDPLGGTLGDQNIYHNDNATNKYLDVGGTYQYAIRRLAQWSGAVKESDVPYTTDFINNVLANGLGDEYAYSKDVAHLENAYVMSLKNNTDDVKAAIIDHGAVGIQYYHNSSAIRFAPNGDYTYYDTATSGYSHNVMIVGYDDTYSKDNFKQSTQPEKDGAWLIRNSWGDGYMSYFWMSYENASLSDAAWVFEMNNPNGEDYYDNNYQLDGGLFTDTVLQRYVGNDMTCANIFTVQNNAKITSEELKAVSLSFTKTANVHYTIEIYTDLQSDNPYSGVKQEAATTEGTTSYAGYYTIPLNKAVNLKKGSRFAILVTPDKYALDMDYGYNTTGKDGTGYSWECPVTQYDGNSYVINRDAKRETKWTLGNFCIKAFTDNNYEEKRDISKAVITANSDFTADNPSVTVVYGNESTLTKGVDYTVSTTTDANGTTVNVTGQGDYTGTLSKTFIPISNLSLKCKDAVYTGKRVTPEVTVKNGETVLKADTDYAVSYSDNIEVSENAVATITGKGDYYGSAEIPFQIYNDIGESLTAFNLGLNGLIEFNVYIQLTDELCRDSNAYVLFTLPDGRKTEKQYVKDAKKVDGYGYIFTCGVYAKEVTKKVSFQVFNGKGIGGKKYYKSVEDYTNVSLNSTKEQSVKVRPLIKALLNYGGYSQNLFNYNTEDMAYKNVKDELQQSMDNLKAEDLSDYKVIVSGKEEGVNTIGLALVLESATTLKYYFQIDSAIDSAKLNVKVDGEKANLKKDSIGYYLEIPSIRSNQLDIVHTMAVGNLTIKCSALSYVYASLKNAKNTNGMLASKALYLYWKESKAYFG